MSTSPTRTRWHPLFEAFRSKLDGVLGVALSRLNRGEQRERKKVKKDKATRSKDITTVGAKGIATNGARTLLVAICSNALVTSSFLLLVVRPGAPSNVLVPSSKDATSSYLLLVVMHLFLVASCS